MHSVLDGLRELPAEALKSLPLISGRDLIASGYSPGPMFGIVLNEVEDAQLEIRISTREEAMEMARERLDCESEPRSPRVRSLHPA